MTISLASLLPPTPVESKVYTIFSGFLKDGQEDPISVSKMKAKDASWKSVARLMLRNVYKTHTKFCDLLLAANTALQSIRCVPNVSYL